MSDVAWDGKLADVPGVVFLPEHAPRTNRGHQRGGTALTSAAGGELIAAWDDE